MAVSDQLKRGIQPELLCATCPWDRLCVTPPRMSPEEVAAKMAEAANKAQAPGANGSQVLGEIMVTALAYGGRASTAELCPVLALRMRGAEGRAVNDLVRERMGGTQ